PSTFICENSVLSTNDGGFGLLMSSNNVSSRVGPAISSLDRRRCPSLCSVIERPFLEEGSPLLCVDPFLLVFGLFNFRSLGIITVGLEEEFAWPLLASDWLVSSLKRFEIGEF